MNIEEARNYFVEQIGLKLPIFCSNTPVDENGNTLFCWRPLEELTFYIHWVAHESGEKFAVEIAWNRSNVLPARWERIRVDRLPIKGGLRCRLEQLWLITKDEVWWSVSKNPSDPISDIKFVKDQIDEVISKLETLGMTYFKDIAEHFAKKITYFYESGK